MKWHSDTLPDGRVTLDITAPDAGVSVGIRGDGKVVWVNIDGVCALRVCQIPHLTVDDKNRLHRPMKVDR